MYHACDFLSFFQVRPAPRDEKVTADKLLSNIDTGDTQSVATALGIFISSNAEQESEEVVEADAASQSVFGGGIFLTEEEEAAQQKKKDDKRTIKFCFCFY